MAATPTTPLTVSNTVLNIFEDRDDDTISLILQLQLEDIGQLRERSRRNRGPDIIDDVKVTLATMEEEVRAAMQLLSDRRMAKSFRAAVRQDAAAIAAAISEGEGAADGHVNMQGTGEDRQDATSMLDPVAELEEITGEHETLRQRNSAPTTQRATDTDDPEPMTTCTACGERKGRTQCIAGPCGHEYCWACVQSLFEAALSDESLFPPRCCQQPIPMSSARSLLTADMEQQFLDKQVEYGTSDRTYCHQSLCSAFIKPDDITNQVGTCAACGLQTCTVCKVAAHVGEDCPEDSTVQAFNQLAADNAWQRCFNCRRMVELDTGCYHMTCLCKSQFCYVCGQRWKTCECPQWDENRLMARAHRIVEREAPGLAANNPARDEVVNAAVQHLRENHECNHTTWDYVRGAHQCEECHQHLDRHIFRCHQCRILACNRCRRNRL